MCSIKYITLFIMATYVLPTTNRISLSLHEAKLKPRLSVNIMEYRWGLTVSYSNDYAFDVTTDW